MSGKDWSSTSEVRKVFVDYFVKKCGHEFVPSSPVVPHDDPTLLFINAGMNQFKPIFVGTVDPNSAFGKLKRAANSQKCIRAGGKHNDLDDVGKDSYHHTFFEMLGNWSFGDYFKTEAIDWAWDLLVNEYKLDPSRIYVTYFGGDPKCPGVPADTEARDLWLKYLPADRVLPYGAKENFWEMAETGPCGPCSEIHYDRIGGRFVPELVNADDPTLVEIWNNVFMQYNREKDQSLTPLPFGSVDTGMGLERLASILIDRMSNYDINNFMQIFERIQSVIPALANRPYTGKFGAEDTDGVDTAYRVVADHIRTLSVAIADGALPSNDGRGYVLRRILRRAVRFGREKLSAPREAWFAKLVQPVVDTLGEEFVTLKERQAHVESVIADEEKQFMVTLDRGLKEFDRMRKNCPAGSKTFPGQDAFTLFTSSGFPLDLTQLMAEEHGMTVDVAAYDAAFEEHRRLAREAGKKKVSEEILLQQEQLHHVGKTLNIAPTDDNEKYNWESASARGPKLASTVKALFDGKVFVESAEAGKTVGVVTETTNFYAEGGGQTADSGRLFFANGSAIVEDVQRFGAFVLHTVKVEEGSLTVNAAIDMAPDFERRQHIGRNHTATHVLNFALRDVFGADCDQKGSLVDENRTRFDCSLSAPPTLEQLNAVENIVNSHIAAARKVHMVTVPLADAFKITGLRAIFGEQYPDPVRVVSLAEEVTSMMKDGFNGKAGMDYSVEFCGGTHVANTSEIGAFVLTAEEGVAKGVRRIVGVTGVQAAEAKQNAVAVEAVLAKANAAQVGAPLEEALTMVRAAVEKAEILPLLVKKKVLLQVEALKLKNLELAKQKSKELLDTANTLAEQFVASSPAANIVLDFPQLEADGKAVDQFAKAVEKALPNQSFLVHSFHNGAQAVVAVVPGATKDGKNASAWMQAVFAVSGGRGGGKPVRAIGAGKDLDAKNIPAAIEAAHKYF